MALGVSEVAWGYSGLGAASLKYMVFDITIVFGDLFNVLFCGGLGWP